MNASRTTKVNTAMIAKDLEPYYAIWREDGRWMWDVGGTMNQGTLDQEDFEYESGIEGNINDAITETENALIKMSKEWEINIDDIEVTV